MDEASAVELEELENLFAKANGLLEKKDYSRSKLIANKLLVHAKQYHSSLFQARAYGLFAFISYNFNEIKKAINFFELSHETYLGLKRVDPLEIFKTRNSLGVVYKLNGELWKSMLVLKSSLELAEQYDIPNSSGYNNIAVIYSSQKKFEKALAFFKMAKKVELRNKKPDDNKINQFDSNIAKMLIGLNRLSEAETILNKTKSFFEDKNDTPSLALNYRCLAQLNFNKGDYEESEKWLLKVLSFSKQDGNNGTDVEVFIDLAKIYGLTSRMKLQEVSLLKALDVAKKINIGFLSIALTSLLNFYERKSDFKEAIIVLAELLQIKRQKTSNKGEIKLLAYQEEFEAKMFNKLIELEYIYNRNLKEKNIELSIALNEHEKLQSRISSLREQLNPGYIFSILQEIQMHAIKKSLIMASDFVAEFAALMRGVLKHSREDLVILQDELDLVKNYLTIEQKREHQKISYQIKVHKNLDSKELMVTPFIVQSFVKYVFNENNLNSINHILINIRRSSPGVYVHVSISNIKESFIIEENEHIYFAKELNVSCGRGNPFREFVGGICQVKKIRINSMRNHYICHILKS